MNVRLGRHLDVGGYGVTGVVAGSGLVGLAAVARQHEEDDDGGEGGRTGGGVQRDMDAIDERSVSLCRNRASDVGDDGRVVLSLGYYGSSSAHPGGSCLAQSCSRI